MLRFFQALMPREDKFFGLFNNHARTLVDGAVALRDLLEGGPGVTAACARIVAHENEADAIDQMQKTAKAITLFEVTSFELHMRQMADIILRCAELTVEAVALLESLRDNVGRINAITEEITRLEEQADELNDQGIKALFLKHRGGDAMGFIVGNEIYDHLEKVVDRFEDVANRISGIVIEQV